MLEYLEGLTQQTRNMGRAWKHPHRNTPKSGIESKTKFEHLSEKNILRFACLQIEGGALRAESLLGSSDWLSRTSLSINMDATTHMCFNLAGGVGWTESQSHKKP